MEEIWVYVAIGALLLAAVSLALACFYRGREKRTLRTLEKMLQEAIDGDFMEQISMKASFRRGKQACPVSFRLCGIGKKSEGGKG